MDPRTLHQVGIAGAGTMGAGIAQVFLGKGFTVHLHDQSRAQLEAAAARIEAGLRRWAARGEIADAGEARGRLHVAPDLAGLRHCPWIIEAVAEDPAVKADVLRRLAALCPPETVFASNTSTISLTWLGTAANRPEQTVGMHFFNPAPLMRLVEVVPGLRTAPAVVEAARALAERLGKVSVVSKDRPGFLSNRILMPLVNEAFWALEEGVGAAADIDETFRLGMNHPLGPLELADLIGLDVCLAILELLHREFGDPKFRPCPLLKKYVEAGWLGRKTGRGVHEYPPAP